jgi:serine/threonine-protein kinase RsbW
LLTCYASDMDRRDCDAARIMDGVVDGEHVCVCIPPLTEYVRVARNVADTVSDMIDLSPEDRAAVKLAVGEACNNAVIHSVPLPPATFAWVEVVLRVTAEALEIEVINPGAGFHPNRSARMPAPEAMMEQGRGLPLMEMLMDTVAYESRGKHTVVRMRLLRPRTTHPT